MRTFDYQRTVIAYHGCDKQIANDVLLRGRKLNPSENDYDWLGKGVYFWEHGPSRALQWAKETKKAKHPAMLGAVLHLGHCFDLLDVRDTKLLADLFPKYRQAYLGKYPARPFLENDLIKEKHYLDCAVINWTIDFLEKENGQLYHSVRGVFQEGDFVFNGSAIKSKSHIQIAIRDPKVIIGFFKPEIDIGINQD